MAARSNGHLKMNAERKLTDEERRKKAEDAKLKDENKGIGAMCFKYVYFLLFFPTGCGSDFARFRIRYLSDPAHKSKVRNNANQDGLTGVIVCQFNFSSHPKCSKLILAL